jgi:hypothetical protein
MPKYWLKDVNCEGILSEVEKHKTKDEKEYIVFVMQQGEYIQAFEVYSVDLINKVKSIPKGDTIFVRGYPATREYMNKYYTTLRATAVWRDDCAEAPPPDYVEGDPDVPF